MAMCWNSDVNSNSAIDVKSIPDTNLSQRVPMSRIGPLLQ